MFTYASLFSGIGGFDLALNDFGGKCVFASEIHIPTRIAYYHLFNFAPIGDIRMVPAEYIEDHDLLVAGFPCPTYSVSGNRAGMDYVCSSCGNQHMIDFDDYLYGALCPNCGAASHPVDERGVLFYEVARIAKEKQPSLLLLENVKGLLSHNKGETLKTMLLILNRLGYKVDFTLLNSLDYALPQNRERVYILASLHEEATPYIIPSIKNTLSTTKKKLLPYIETFNFDWPESIGAFYPVKYFIELDVEEKYYIEQHIYKTNGSINDDHTPKSVAGWVVRDDRVFAYKDDAKRSTLQGYVYNELSGVVEALTASNVPKIVIEQKIGHETIKRVRRITPLEAFRVQGFPDYVYYTLKRAGISDTHMYQMAGNAVSVPVVKAIIKKAKESRLF